MSSKRVGAKYCRPKLDFRAQWKQGKYRRKRILFGRRSANYWFRHSQKLYSKVYISEVERLWLDNFLSGYTIVYKFVDGHENMPRFKQGLWNGKAYFIHFNSVDDANVFKVKWWSKRGTF